MNKSRNNQSVTNKLPEIIAEKKVFSQMSRPERTVFYNSVNETLKGIDKKYICHQDNYKKMLLYPERFLIKAFLENRFKSEEKWQIYTSVLEHCLTEHLMTSLNNFQEKYQAMKVDMKKAEKRIKEMSSDIKKYVR